MEIPQPSPPPCGSKAQSVIASACWQPLHRRYTITRHPSPVTHHLLLITRYSLRVTEYLRGRNDLPLRHPPHNGRATQSHCLNPLHYGFPYFYLCPIYSSASICELGHGASAFWWRQFRRPRRFSFSVRCECAHKCIRRFIQSLFIS